MGSGPPSSRPGAAAIIFGLLLAGPAVLRAQEEKPVAPESLDGSSVLQPGEAAGRQLILGGFGVVSYADNLTTGESSFADSALAISLAKVLSDRISVFAQLTASRESASPFLGDQGNFGSDVSTDIDNLQITWMPSAQRGIHVTIGKFDSPLALERDDAPLNYQATSSFTFDFARPVKFTGLLVHEAFSPRLEGYAIVGNGWNNDTDNNKAKTAALYGVWNPTLRYHVGLGVIQGGEKSGQTGDARTTAMATILMQPVDSWVYGEELVAGREPHAAIDGSLARWYADMLFLHHRFARHWAATLRAEYLDDAGGSRTGRRQVLRSVTVSPQYLVGGAGYGVYRTLEKTTLPLPELALRLDLRWNHSSERAFRDRREEAGRRDAYSATLQTVFLF